MPQKIREQLQEELMFGQEHVDKRVFEEQGKIMDASLNRMNKSVNRLEKQNSTFLAQIDRLRQERRRQVRESTVNLKSVSQVGTSTMGRKVS